MAPPTAVGHIILAGHHWSQSSIQTIGVCSALFSHLPPPYGRGGKVKMCSAAWCLFSLGIFYFPSSLCLELTAAVLSRGCTLASPAPFSLSPGTWPATGTGSKVQNICTTFFFLLLLPSLLNTETICTFQMKPSARNPHFLRSGESELLRLSRKRVLQFELLLRFAPQSFIFSLKNCYYFFFNIVHFSELHSTRWTRRKVFLAWQGR